MSNKYRDTRTQQRVTIAIGLLLTFAMAASAILPLLQSATQFTAPVDQAQPTQPPAATVPAPPDPSTITFNEQYVHPTGIFSAAIPAGYNVTTEYNDEDEAQVVMRNPQQLSVAEVRVLTANDAESAEDLNDVFTSDWLQSSWREYTSWDESRRVVNDEGQLEIDFSLRRGNQNYIARQIAYVQDGYVYMTRVVTPDNASEALRHILTNLSETVQPNPAFLTIPLDWEGYYDNANGHLIRFPSDWVLADAAPGVPASITADDVALRVEATDASIASSDDARAYVENNRAGVTIESVSDVEQNGATGYRVAYTLTTPDGAPISGAVVLLAGESQTHIADLRVNNAGAVDLNSDDAAETYSELINVLNSFSLLGSEVASADE